jgi:choline-glycine betaine transporter
MMILSGDYHSGPFSLLIPFGIWGVLAFLAFIILALRVLYRNYRHGDAGLLRINTFLLSYFVAKLVFFLGVFGAIHLDVAVFAGIVGLSVSFNGGMCQPKPLQPRPAKRSEDDDVFVVNRPGRRT